MGEGENRVHNKRQLEIDNLSNHSELIGKAIGDSGYLQLGNGEDQSKLEHAVLELIKLSFPIDVGKNLEKDNPSKIMENNAKQALDVVFDHMPNKLSKTDLAPDNLK